MRPNFLFIITDQQRADDLGCYGNRIVATPHIDRLASQGVAMDRAYVSSPVCMPNRSTLMTGRLPSLHGVRSNGISLPLDAVTVPALLRAAGYRTAMIGKSHLQNFTGLPAVLPREQFPPGHAAPPPELAEARATGQGDYLQEDLARWRGDTAPDLQLPYYGFDHVDLALGHGDEVDGHYGRWLRATAPGLDAKRRARASGRAPGWELDQAWTTPLPEDAYPTSYLARRCVEQIQAYAQDREQPFFLYCSFPDPHHPFTPPGRFRDMYRPEDMPLPASWPQPGRDEPAHVQWLHAQRAAGKANTGSTVPYACTERETREALALTYGMITMIDEAVGAIVKAIDEQGLRENTVIVFTTDHGDYLGDHGLMLKGPIHYRSLIQTPLVWCDPTQPSMQGRRSDALCSTLDIARTLLDRACLQPANGMQGQSLLPVLEGRAQGHAQAVLIEDEVQRTFLGFQEPPRVRTLVTSGHRMTVYLGADWGELYDLAEDPLELRNLWSDPSALQVRTSLLNELALQMIAHTDRSPRPTHVA